MSVWVRVERRTRRPDSVLTLTLRSEDGAPLPGWTPGAHVDVHTADGDVRQYSLCGDPADLGSYRISILRETQGRVSTWLHEHAVEGTRLALDGPRNHFELTPAGRYVFVAGGIGITPILPMIRAVAGSGGAWSLHYGGRSRETMAHLDEVTAAGPQVTVVPEDPCGTIDLESLLAQPEPDTLVYCCGPSGMIDAVRRAMSSWPAEALRVERFSADPDADLSQDSEFTVRCDASGVEVAVNRGESIVQALRRAGIDVTTSCGEGTCGTCETEVLEGLPDHRDGVLSESERAGNELIMPCVSRSFSPLLVLDL